MECAAGRHNSEMVNEDPDVHRGAEHCTVQMGHDAWQHSAVERDLVDKLDQHRIAMAHSVVQVDGTVAGTFAARTFVAHTRCIQACVEEVVALEVEATKVYLELGQAQPLEAAVGQEVVEEVDIRELEVLNIDLEAVLV